MNTLDEVQVRIRANLSVFEQGEGVQQVAEVGGTVVGTVTLRRNSHPLLAHRAELDSFVVHGDYRRQGIARRLVEESRARAAAMGIEVLEVQCRGRTAAEQVYPRLGFLEYGPLPRGIVEPWGDRKVFDVVYFYQPVECRSDE
jgi:GNAT superfamily N-acetyltransferase